MKKVLTLVAFFVLLLNYSNGQVRITEVKPINGNAGAPEFFELFYKGTIADFSTYKLVIYRNRTTGNANQQGKIVTVGSFNTISKFGSSTSNTVADHTQGTVSFSTNSLGQPDYSTNYSVAFSTVNYYVVSGNTVGNGTQIANKNPFFNQAYDIQTNDKFAAFLFNGSTLVDFVTDVDTNSVVNEFGSIEPFSGNGTTINLKNIKVSRDKYISPSLGASTSYDLKSTTGACKFQWERQTSQNPGFVTALINNTATWDQDYYLWTSSSSYSQPTNTTSYFLFNETTGTIESTSSGSYLSNGKFEFFLEVINPTQFMNQADPGLELKLSIFADKDVSGAGVGVYNPSTNGDFYLNEYPSTGTQFAQSTTIYKTINNVVTAVKAYKISFDRSQIRVAPNVDQYFPIYLGLQYSSGTNCYAPNLQKMTIPYALPVTLGDITLKTINNSNNLTWSTSSESNNKGFEVQRSMGHTNDFKTIGFVGTRAKDGNSQTEISYSFEDPDVKPGQTHFYRLNQIDFDGKSAFSPVKSIKPGSIESNLNVYPNPSQGSFTVNTGSTSGKLNIFVMDNTGRVVNQYMNVSTTNTKISNLKKGFYTLKIVNTESGEQSAQRVVVQ